MKKYYIVIETQAPYVFKKYSIVTMIDKLTEKTLENILKEFEYKNKLGENTTIITFIKELESEEL